MRSREVTIRLKEDFYEKLKEAHPEGVCTYIRKLVEREAFRSHKGNNQRNGIPLGSNESLGESGEVREDNG